MMAYSRSLEGLKIACHNEISGKNYEESPTFCHILSPQPMRLKSWTMLWDGKTSMASLRC